MSDGEETFPIVINERLNNSLIKMDLKVINNYTYMFIYLKFTNDVFFKIYFISFQFDDSAIRKINRPAFDFNKPLVQNNPGFSRVQDADLMLMIDPGLCLSIDQPYASLLLLNIKR